MTQLHAEPTGNGTMDKLIVYHIRAPKPRKGSNNKFYPQGAARITKTLCGAPTTDKDDEFSWKTDAEPIGRHVVCQECLRIKKESKTP